MNIAKIPETQDLRNMMEAALRYRQLKLPRAAHEIGMSKSTLDRLLRGTTKSLEFGNRVRLMEWLGPALFADSIQEGQGLLGALQAIEADGNLSKTDKKALMNLLEGAYTVYYFRQASHDYDRKKRLPMNRYNPGSESMGGQDYP